MILLTGAAGKTGQAIIAEFARSGEKARAMVSRAAHIPLVTKLGAVEAVRSDMGDRDAFTRAAQGARAIYHICPNVSPHEIAFGGNALHAAREAGVELFVYHSVLHPQTEDMPHHWKKMRVEELIFKSGLPFTILQPAAYMQNILAQRESILNEGVFRNPYRVGTRISMVDLADVAEAAAKALTEPGHAGATYELCGPMARSQVEIAEVFQRVLGRKVRAEEILLHTWTHNAAQSGMSPDKVQALVKMFRYYDRHGFEGNSNALTNLLGRPPTDFETFVRRAF